MKDLLAVLGLLVLLWVLWFVFIKTPGNERVDGRFLQEPFTEDYGTVHDDGPFRDDRAQNNEEPSTTE